MGRRKRTIPIITGILLGLFVIEPTLRYLGVPTFNRFLTFVFGDDNPIAIVFSVLLIISAFIWINKKPKQHLFMRL